VKEKQMVFIVTQSETSRSIVSSTGKQLMFISVQTAPFKESLFEGFTLEDPSDGTQWRYDRATKQFCEVIQQEEPEQEETEEQPTE
jgi:hypothetical protein